MTTRITEAQESLGLEREALLEMLRAMILGRRYEEKTAEMYQLGEIGGFCHLYIGQEAVAVGAITPLREDDYVITAYREHVHALVRGLDPRSIMAELFGRSTGCSKGKGGSMHLFDASLNFLGGHAIVGGHLPLAVGVGYAIRYRDSDAVCVCFLGDSVANIGAFNESLNMAALFQLPVVFVIENNEYGMGTAVHRAAAIENLADRACAYSGMQGWTIDGMDVIEVRRTVVAAIERAREHKLPSLIEAKTYRFVGHSMSDPNYGHYRTKEEVKEFKAKDDPIKRYIEALKRQAM
ncbi:MAG: thiamine pyrophosphate-dependent enzyme, partial [Gemmatimonadales bacterium]